MWQRVSRVRLELDALFEVDQIELNFVGPVMQRRVCDHGVQQRGFTGASLPRNQDVLRSAFAKPQMLELRRSRASERNFDPATTVVSPPLIVRRRDHRERHLNANRFLGPLTNRLDDFGEVFVGGGLVQCQRQVLDVLFDPMKAAAVPLHGGGVGFEIGQVEVARQLDFRIGAEQRVHAALRAASHDTQQPLGSFFRKTRGEVRNNQDVKRFGNLARVGVVLVDRLELVSQIRLNHVFHVFRQIRQPLRDMRTLRPNAMRHEFLVIVRQVHKR